MTTTARKPKLLLINPWIYDFTAFDLWGKPVGLLYLASYLREIGYEIFFFDCLDKYHPLFTEYVNKIPRVKKFGTGPFHREKIRKPEILQFVPRQFSRYGVPEETFIRYLESIPVPEAVLITSFMTYWYMGPERVCQIIREKFGDIPVILGGIYATLLPEHARATVKADALITGPGELEVEKLLRNLIPDAPVSGSVRKSLDDFPPPAFDLYSRLDYLPVMTSRGCPYRCTFCATDKISGPYAQRNPENVFLEIRNHTRRFRVRDVAFYDDALLLNRESRIVPLLQKITEQKLNLRFHTPNGLHARQIDIEVASLFYRSGFTTIRLSFETADPARQKDMQHKVSPDQLREAVYNLVTAGYPRKNLEAYVMMGLPHQSLEEVYDSMFFVHSVGIRIKLASYSPIPGTPDFEKSVRDSLFPEKADPLLTNKSIFPLYRTAEAIEKFSHVRQLANVLNYAVERNVNFFGSPELGRSLYKMTGKLFP